MQKVRRAVGVIVIRDSKVLMLKRRENDRAFPGSWCFPGGKCDDQCGKEEPFLFAILRETLEETGQKLKSIRLDGRRKTTKPDNLGQIYDIAVFYGSFDGDVELSDEHEEFRWVTPEEALLLPVAGEVTRDLLEELKALKEDLSSMLHKRTIARTKEIRDTLARGEDPNTMRFS